MDQVLFLLCPPSPPVLSQGVRVDLTSAPSDLSHIRTLPFSLSAKQENSVETNIHEHTI